MLDADEVEFLEKNASRGRNRYQATWMEWPAEALQLLADYHAANNDPSSPYFTKISQKVAAARLRMKFGITDATVGTINGWASHNTEAGKWRI